MQRQPNLDVPPYPLTPPPEIPQSPQAAYGRLSTLDFGDQLFTDSSVYLFVYMFVCLHVCLHVCLFVYLFVYLILLL